jgi:hypothetical protein
MAHPQAFSLRNANPLTMPGARQSRFAASRKLGHDLRTTACPLPVASPSGARCWWCPAASTWPTTSSSPNRSRPRSTACAPRATRSPTSSPSCRPSWRSWARGRAARAVGAARGAPDAAAGRSPERGREALDQRAALQRRMGADHPAGGHRAPVRRDGGRVPARAQGRPRAGGRAHAAPHEGHGRRAGAEPAAPQARRRADDEDRRPWPRATASTCRWC